MAKTYTKEEVDKMIAELRKEIKVVSEADKRTDIRFSSMEEKRYGLKVNEILIVPRKNITSGGACKQIGDIGQRTNVDGDLYICGRSNTWEKVGAQ